MISFFCPSCRKAYSLKPEFAGRKTTCSGCNEPLVVPASVPTREPLVRPRTAFPCLNCGMKFNVAEEFAGVRRAALPAGNGLPPTQFWKLWAAAKTKAP